MSLDHLIFDTTSAQTKDDTHSVGAFIRSGNSGALVTNHSLQKPSAGSFVFVDGDVTVGSDSIAETAHGFQTGDKVQLTTSGVLPAGLALLTDYFVIRVDANNIKLASSAKNAEDNIPVDITAAAGGGNHTITGMETEGRSLDVWISNPSIGINDNGGSITVDAVNLDIRDLAFATDKVDVSGSTVELGATTLAALENIVVSGTVELGATTLAALENITVSATDLDIRNLDYSQDNVAIKGATGNQLAINADGSLNVNADISVVNGHEKAEDAAHASSDIGSYVLAVRQDTLANSVSADGDYASFKVDALGALYANISNTVSVNDAALALTAIANAAETLDVANTSQNIIVSPLSNRKYLFIYNNDNAKMFIGSAGVTSANGFPVSPGAYMELRAGAAVDLEFVSSKLNHEIRTMELS